MPWLYLTNILLGITGLVQVLTGLGLVLDLDFVEDMHVIAGFLMSGLLILHVRQNWNWVCKHVFSKN